MGEPQVLQKWRRLPGLYSNALSAESPEVMARSFVCTKPFVAKAVPLDLRHKEQWQ
jgi:hypothetical protein